jgi:hypothetical protein
MILLPASARPNLAFSKSRMACRPGGSVRCARIDGPPKDLSAWMMGCGKRTRIATCSEGNGCMRWKVAVASTE